MRNHQHHRDEEQQVIRALMKSEENPAHKPCDEDDDAEETEYADSTEHGTSVLRDLDQPHASGNAASRVPTLKRTPRDRNHRIVLACLSLAW